METTKSTCACCKSKVVIGVLLFVIGCILGIPAVFFMDIFEYMVGKNLVLKNGTEAYRDWHSAPVPVYMTYHIYNYTNVEEILSNHSKPNVTQIGPYIYKEVRINNAIDYNDYNITYFQYNSYVFDKNLSCPLCSEDDVVFSPSITAMTLINVIHDHINSTSPQATLVDNFFKRINQLSLFKRLTVKQVVWGYNDTLLSMIKDIESFLKDIGVILPPLINTVVALQLNSTAGMLDTGNVTCLTGKEDIKDIQKIVRWRGLDEAPYWMTKYGRMINGTDGSRAPPFTSRDDTLYTFVTQLCRSLYVKYSRDVTVRGIDTFQFTTTPELFANHSVNPDNIAFCSEERCWGSGILPISQCRHGVPIFMSAPHFYQGDPKFAEAIDGMHPNETLHRTYMNIEPNTGMALEAHKRLQINIMVKKSFLSISEPLLNEYNFIPILFVDEGVIIDEKTAKTLHDEVIYPKTILMYSQYVLIGVGSALILYAFTVVVIWISSRHERMSYEQFFDDKEIINTDTVPHDTNKVPHDTNKIPHDRNRIPHGSNRIPHEF